MIKSLYYFLRLIHIKKNLLMTMAARELRQQYVGSLLGFIWTFIHPMVLISVLWLVFSVGFRTQPMNDVPFIVWLASGLAVWFVFSDIVSGAAGVIVGNTHLIKKTFFHSQILPVIKLITSLITHHIFLVLLIILIIFNKMPFSIYYLQGIYYLFGLSVFALGIGLAVSALNVFIRDVSQLVVVLLQAGFWATPIFWDIHMMPLKVQVILKLNPIFYIVQGYRESFIYFYPFWNHPYQTVYFWCVALITLAVGGLIFKKLKPHFADIL